MNDRIMTSSELLRGQQELAELIDRVRARVGSDAEAEKDALAVEQLLVELSEARQNADVDDSLRRNQAALMSLTRSEAIGQGRLDDALREITEVAAEILGVGRSSIWRYDDAQSKIVCVDLFVSKERTHEGGIELSKVDFPKYFDALRSERII